MNSIDPIRNDWSRAEIEALYQQPLMDLIFQAQQVHRQYFDANTVQVSTLLSIKTGKCPEDCKYCSQSAHYDSKLEAEKRIAVEKVIQEAKKLLPLAVHVSVWEQRGVIRMNVICLMYWTWYVKSKHWDSKPV